MHAGCSLRDESPGGPPFGGECERPRERAAPVPAPQQAAAATTADAGSQVCPSCGTVSPAGEAFCANCGSMLSGASAPAAATPDATPTPAAAPAPVSAPVATMPALTARLIVEADNQEFDLSGKDNVLIGREDAVSNIFPDVDLTPHGGEDGGVSRMHARIFVENGQYMLEDENSTNFTFLNWQKLAGKTPTPLHDNDEIKLGRVLLRFKEA